MLSWKTDLTPLRQMLAERFPTVEFTGIRVDSYARGTNESLATISIRYNRKRHPDIAADVSAVVNAFERAA